MENRYLLHGKLTAKAGLTDELANILLEASKLASTAKGFKLYVIGKDPNDTNSSPVLASLVAWLSVLAILVPY